MVPRTKRTAPEWELRYARKLLITDITVIVVAVFGAQLLRFGVAMTELHVPFSRRGEFAVTYTAVSVLLVAAWLTLLALWDTRRPTIFGTGPDEYKRVTNATFAAFGAFAIVAFLLKAQIGRGYLIIALPAGLILLLLGRWLWRKRLHRRRTQGHNSYRTLIVGERQKVAHVAGQILSDTSAGFELIGAVTARGTNTDVEPGLPVMADYANLVHTVDECGVDTVIITSTDDITPQRLREIGWELEARRVDLIVTAALTDIAGPRIHMRPVSGLPLIHVDYPEFSGRKFFAKRMFDLLGSLVLIILSSPVMLVVALGVKLTSRGPVFYAQERIGWQGRPFKMFKFRSMVQNADHQLKSLLDAQGTSDKPLHKIDNDPRITPFGRFIRKYSLDELPQFFNVFIGTMSLVGPRPQRDSEVALYLPHHHRRHMVKPGITGLWQVSGRSDLDWEDSVRLDLYYVENWSMIGDLVLIWRTVKTVLRPDGAY